MDMDQIIKDLERRLKIRVLQEFEDAQQSVRQLEREFAIEALDKMRRQPAMADFTRED